MRALGRFENVPGPSAFFFAQPVLLDRLGRLLDIQKASGTARARRPPPGNRMGKRTDGSGSPESRAHAARHERPVVRGLRLVREPPDRAANSLRELPYERPQELCGQPERTHLSECPSEGLLGFPPKLDKVPELARRPRGVVFVLQGGRKPPRRGPQLVGAAKVVEVVAMRERPLLGINAFGMEYVGVDVATVVVWHPFLSSLEHSAFPVLELTKSRAEVGEDRTSLPSFYPSLKRPLCIRSSLRAFRHCQNVDILVIDMI